MTVSRKVASVWALTVVVCMAMGGGSFAAETVRTWTDATGTFSVRAKIVGFDGGVVRLTKEDGAVVSLPLERLSAGDQAYVRAYDASNPFRAKAPPAAMERPTIGRGRSSAGSAPGASSDTGASSGAATSLGGIVAPPVVWADVPKLTPESGTRPLSVSLAPVVPCSPAYQRSFALPSGDAFERMSGLWLDGAAMSGILGISFEPPQRPVSARVIRIDLATGDAEKPVDLPAGTTPIGWDGAGRRVVVRDTDKRGLQDSFLAVLRLTDAGFEGLLTIKPYDPKEGHEQVVWAAFCQEERLATLSDTGRFAIWSLVNGKPLAYQRLVKDAAVQRSEDGRVVAFASGSSVQFVDVTTLSTVGCLADLKLPKAIAFSPDGASVAVRATNGGVWKLADLARLSEIDGSNASGSMFFADSRSLLDGARMFDAATGSRIFEIKGETGPSASAGDKAWFVFEEKSKKTRAMHPEKGRPSNADEKLADMGPDPKGFILPPRQPIRVDVKLLPEKEDLSKVKAHLEESVTKAEHQVDENATMTLVASAWPREKPMLIKVTHVRERTWDDLRGPLTGFGGFGGFDGFGEFPGGGPSGLPNFPTPRGFPTNPRPPGFPEIPPLPTSPSLPSSPGGTVVEKITLHAVLVIEMSLELEYLGQTLWSTKAIPMQNRNRLEVPKEYSLEEFLARLSSDDLQTFLRMSVPKSIARTGAHSRPACGYFELSLSGLVPAKDQPSKKPTTQQRK